MHTNISSRQIAPTDNPTLAYIIRHTLEEFNANKCNSVYYDTSTDHLYELFYNTPKSVYFVALQDNVIVGGAGVFPTNGLDADTCELVKMYLLPQARGTGLGRHMVEKCLQWAKEQGHKKVYLETMPELKTAIQLYEKTGFDYLPHALGCTGHTACNIWMQKGL